MKNKFTINLEVTLVEIILSVLIFAIAGVISLNSFAIAKFTQIKANDKVIAGNLIQSNVEIIKSLNSYDEAEIFLLNNFELMKNESNTQKYVNFYDKNWKTSNEANKEYFITVVITEDDAHYGAIKGIAIKAEKVKPYPFINKNNNNQDIFSLETKKFYPSF